MSYPSPEKKKHDYSNYSHFLQTGGVERSSGDGAENGSSGESLDDRGGSGGDDNIVIQESETVTDVRLIEPSDKVGCSPPRGWFAC